MDEWKPKKYPPNIIIKVDTDAKNQLVGISLKAGGLDLSLGLDGERTDDLIRDLQSARDALRSRDG